MQTNDIGGKLGPSFRVQSMAAELKEAAHSHIHQAVKPADWGKRDYFCKWLPHAFFRLQLLQAEKTRMEEQFAPEPKARRVGFLQLVTCCCG